MNDIFITKIEIKKVRNIENFTIPLSKTERKHLIITGKNGSGKTSLLQEINKFLDARIKWQYPDRVNISVIPRLKQKYDDFGKNINIPFKNSDFLHPNFKDGKYILLFFDAKRLTSSMIIPKGINTIEFKKNYIPVDKINQNFIQYIVNLKFDSLVAKVDNDIDSSTKIDKWFEDFENQLKILFDAPDLKLVFDRKNYNFYIQIGTNEPFTLAQLSDGYSAVLSIITELILRMEATENKAYDLQGVVLIDEIETHLHVDLQKKSCRFCVHFSLIFNSLSPRIRLLLFHRLKMR